MFIELPSDSSYFSNLALKLFQKCKLSGGWSRMWLKRALDWNAHLERPPSNHSWLAKLLRYRHHSWFVQRRLDLLRHGSESSSSSWLAGWWARQGFFVWSTWDRMLLSAKFSSVQFSSVQCSSVQFSSVHLGAESRLHGIAHDLLLMSLCMRYLAGVCPMKTSRIFYFII